MARTTCQDQDKMPWPEQDEEPVHSHVQAEETVGALEPLDGPEPAYVVRSVEIGPARESSGRLKGIAPYSISSIALFYRFPLPGLHNCEIVDRTDQRRAGAL